MHPKFSKVPYCARVWVGNCVLRDLGEAGEKDDMAALDGFNVVHEDVGESVREQLVGQQLVEARIRRRPEDVRDLIPGQFLLGAPP